MIGVRSNNDWRIPMFQILMQNFQRYDGDMCLARS